MDTSRSYLEPSSFSKKIAAAIIIAYTVITLIPISSARDIIAFLVMPSNEASKFGVKSSLFFITKRFWPT